MNIYKFNNLRINSFHVFFGWKISPTFLEGEKKMGREGLKRENREKSMIRSPWIQLNRFAIKSVIEWKIWGKEGRKEEWKLVRADDFVTPPPLHPQPLLTVVGKYSRGSPMEKLGKYQGNSISGLNSTSSRSLLFRFSVCISSYRNWICIYVELENTSFPCQEIWNFSSYYITIRSIVISWNQTYVVFSFFLILLSSLLLHISFRS